MTNGNDSAFVAVTADIGKEGEVTGLQTTQPLTKREYFAAMAMQALIANPERYKYVTQRMDTPTKPWSHEDATRHNAEKAVYFADALIEALNQEKQP